ncbi:MAG: DnaD domain protein [Clostridia bacterium]|nr:DnaD domain protein [Clostridia bacterium]
MIHFAIAPRESWFLVPAAVARDHLQAADEQELKVLLTLLWLGREATEESVTAHLAITPTELARCVEAWLARGVLKMEGRFVALVDPRTELAKQAAPGRRAGVRRPTYDLQQVSEALAANHDLRSALRAGQSILNRSFSQTEYEVLYSLHDYYGLPPETILLLMGHCAALGRTSARAIEEVAAEWHRRGIVTAAEATAFLEDDNRRRGHEATVRRLFGLGSRTLSPKERDLIARWCIDFGFGEAMLETAYNRCVDLTGKLSFAYINRILEGWHTKGLSTPEEALADQPPPRRGGGKKRRKVDTDTPASSDLEDFSAWAFQAIYGDGTAADGDSVSGDNRGNHSDRFEGK